LRIEQGGVGGVAAFSNDIAVMDAYWLLSVDRITVKLTQLINSAKLVHAGPHTPS
jgi:hypothetical protein